MSKKRYCSICGKPSVETLQRRRPGVGVFTLYGCEEHSDLVLYDYMDAYVEGAWRPRDQIVADGDAEAKLL